MNLIQIITEIDRQGLWEEIIEAWEDRMDAEQPAPALRIKEPSKPTGYGQLLLDLICDAIQEQFGMGHLGPLGEVREVTAYLSRVTGKSRASIAGAITHLERAGYLAHNDLVGGYVTCDESFRIEHAGWQQYCRFDRSKIDMEDWEEWDGYNGLHGHYELPNWAKMK